MADRELSYKITTDSQQAIAGFAKFGSAVKKELKATRGELDDTRSAGEKVADSIKRLADESVVELRRSEEAAEALRVALGDTTGTLNVDQAVADLRALGLTFDDIKADADALALAIEHVDAQTVDVDTTPTKQGFDDVAESARGAEGATNSFVGNAVSEIPGISETFGPLGEAVGQFTEQLAAGEIGIRDLVAAAGPMAAVTVGVLAVTRVIGEFQNRSKFSADLVADWSAALEEAGDAAKNLTRAQREANDAPDSRGFVRFGTNLLPFSKATNDLADDILRAGLTVEQFNQMAEDGPDAIAAWARAQEAAGNSVDLTVFTAATEQFKALGEAQEKAAVNAQVFALSEEEVAAAAQAQDLASAIDASAASYDVASTKAEIFADTQQKIADKAQAAADALNEQVDGYTTAADAQLDAEEAAQTFTDTLKDHESTQADVRDAAVAAAKANVAWADAMATASGKALTSTEKVDAMNDSLLDQALKAGPKARGEIVDYIASLNGIDEKKATEVTAVLDAFGVEAAKLALDQASAPRDAAITADANTRVAEDALNTAARDRDSTITARVTLPNGWTLDRYGVVRGPGGIVLQSAPAPVEGGPTPTPTARGATPVASPSSTAPAGPSLHTVPFGVPAGNRTFNVTVNTRAQNGRETAAALDRWYRVNGGR